MGNFIFGYSAAFDNKFFDYTPSMTNPDSNNPVSNLKLYQHLKRGCMSSAKTETRITLDKGSPINIDAIFLNDVNFVHAHIEESENGTVWTLIQGIDIVNDEEVWRYKGYYPLTGCNKRYISVLIPAQDPIDGLSVFRCSSIILINTKIELSSNPSYDYEKWAEEAEPQVNPFSSGGEEVVSMGDDLICQIKFGFRSLADAFKSSINQLNRIRRDQLIVLFENLGDNSQSYLIRKKIPIRKSKTSYQINQVETIEFKEVV